MEDFRKELGIIFYALSETVFPKLKPVLDIPDGLNIGNVPEFDFIMNSGKFEYYTSLNRNKVLYTKVTLNMLGEKDNSGIVANDNNLSRKKEYRDKLVDVLHKKNIDMIIGERMALSVNTKELLHEYRHLITSVKITNKFQL